ncbi:hypothetical protein T4A_9379 [Trichinella pseudospiralis]|uniref:Uncharacterized protein n=1 Tax=Trichinella pseudospiralis TaxID=6337 RepID=A0A0V1ENB1_TRIPS|nr:hypothetical protein T4A_9379 [Trichinella pseudospiralis]
MLKWLELYNIVYLMKNLLIEQQFMLMVEELYKVMFKKSTCEICSFIQLTIIVAWFLCLRKL